MAKVNIKKRALSLQQQEAYLERNNIFAVPEKKAIVRKEPSNPDRSIKQVPEHDPILPNRTSNQQEERAFQVMWDFCQGVNVEEGHVLIKHKTKFLQSKPGWEKLVEEFGFWGCDVHHVYMAFSHSGADRARGIISQKCHYNAQMCNLLERYAQKQELQNMLGRWPMASIHDEHPWVRAQRLSSYRNTD